jgi:hypothetical protein
MKYLITENQYSKTLKPLLEKFGMRTLCKMTDKEPEDIIDKIGLKGTREDIIFLTKTIFENDLSSVLIYCNYRIIPTQYSMDLVVYIPKPLPENVGRYMFDQGTRSVYRDAISEALYKFGGGLIRGHNIEVYNTGNC